MGLFHRSHIDIKLQVIAGAANEAIISFTCDCSAISQKGCCDKGLRLQEITVQRVDLAFEIIYFSKLPTGQFVQQFYFTNTHLTQVSIHKNVCRNVFYLNEPSFPLCQEGTIQ